MLLMIPSIPILLLMTCLFWLMIGCQSNQSGESTRQADSADSSQPVAVPTKPEEEIKPLAIGEQAPDFELKATDDKRYSLQDFSSSKLLAIIFTCNHCPTAQAYEQRMIDLANDYSRDQLAVVAISPNYPEAVLLEELGYSDLGDTFEEMKIRAEYLDYNFPYLFDGDTQETTVAYGPQATPHVFLFDEDRLLQYQGRLDAHEKPGTGQAEDIRQAIDRLLAGEKPEEPTTKTFGCSIKWAWKTDWRDKVNADWSAKPVNLQNISPDSLELLLANDTENLRLINFWATWCGPCIVEYPEFIDMYRMYQNRNFEFISVSTDDPAKRDEVLKFLKKKESAVPNYIFSTNDQESFFPVVDPEWSGALPYTLLIAPGGEILYRVQNSIDPLDLKRKIIDSEYMGRYY